MSDDNNLWHQSGVNPKGEPFIQLILNGRVVAQMSADEARAHALAMLAAAEAAEQDAFLVSWAKVRVNPDPKIGAMLLAEFRDWREKQTGKQSGQKVMPDTAERQ